MKKILLSVLFLFPVYAANGTSAGIPANALMNMQIHSSNVASAEEPKKGCQPVRCNTSMGNDRLNADTLLIGTANNAASCYICENGYCEDGDIVYDLNVPRFVKCKQSHDWIGDDKWISYSPPLCDANQKVYDRVFGKGDSGLEKIWDIDGIEHKGGEAAGNNTKVHAAGKPICYKYRCIGNLNWSVEKGKCVAGESKLPPEEDKKKEDDWKEKCKSTGGVPGNNFCVCETFRNLKIASSEAKYCVCISADYVYDSGKQMCVQKKPLNVKPGETKQQKCEKSWGTYAGGVCSCDATSKNLKLENGECVCIDAKYVRDDVSKSCVLPDLTERKNKCEAASASGAYWDNGECKCRDIEHKFIGEQCVKNPDIEICEKIQGAEWSFVLNDCECEDENMRLNDAKTKCIESEDARREREAEEQAAIIIAIKSRIKTASKTLDEIRAGFDVSVWKDKEGKFNTSRLVSDSVAGVVLGTAGGLITSNVVKKNQVENGFEDIQCTVGGQVVANWGDEFRVGIQ